MVPLSALSKIGFGGYRISVRSAQHRDALRRALACGCNLVDTAANYMNGDSERLVGEVLAAAGERDAFVVTKAGYVQGESQEIISGLRRAHRSVAVTTMPDGSSYSIHPSYLDEQIELSSRRLRRRCIDGFLLHNPEHALQGVSPAAQHAAMRAAFEVLEEAVAAGRIRYYGVSSNTLPHPSAAAPNLLTILAAAQEVSQSPHLKLIQFPFNLLETGATTPGPNGASLVDLARARGIRILTNRPLNARFAGGVVRLATYDDPPPPGGSGGAACAMDDCLALLRRRFAALGLAEDPADLTVVQILRSHGQSLSSDESVDQLFGEMFYPLLSQIYPDGVPEQEQEAYRRLHGYARAGARATMTCYALALRRELVSRGVLAGDDSRPLAVAACASYLRAGIHHVLVGMRDVRYVESLRELF
jgi:aryl-alcohol dehydrogenase-like predicted oxidoreductase